MKKAGEEAGIVREEAEDGRVKDSGVRIGILSWGFCVVSRSESVLEFLPEYYCAE